MQNCVERFGQEDPFPTYDAATKLLYLRLKPAAECYQYVLADILTNGYGSTFATNRRAGLKMLKSHRLSGGCRRQCRETPNNGKRQPAAGITPMGRKVRFEPNTKHSRSFR